MRQGMTPRYLRSSGFMSKIYFVVGVNGIGKSTVIPLLQRRLDSDTFTVHDFDERGVPNNADSTWRASEAVYWAGVGKNNLEKGISTVVCGFIKAKEITVASEAVNLEIEVCLLDATPRAIESRILSRYTTPESLQELERTTGKTPEKFVQDNVWVSGKFREEATQTGYFILDTSDLTPEQIATALVNWF